MNKQKFAQYIFVLPLLLVSIASWAGPVDKELAKSKAQKFMMEHNFGVALESDEPAYAPTRRMGGMKAGAELPAFYIFNAENCAGYVIISGDDRTDEVLGYATEGHFDLEDIPDNVAAWLQTYADQIALIATMSQQPQAARVSSVQWAAIAPMITSIWHQDTPYNNQCPLHEGDRSATGCTATALAQIMRYHEWPAESATAIPAYTTRSAKLYCPELPATTFRWSEMLDEYPYTAEAPAVSELMLYCGQGAQADYTSTVGTGISLENAAYALKKYFNYDVNLEYRKLSNYTIDEWEQMLYSELQAGRPVLFAGESIKSAHAFVCDGYDGNGLYHFNWGWGGILDGYFKLALINPQAPLDGYNLDQRMVVGIQPPTGEPARLQLFTPQDVFCDEEELLVIFDNPNLETITAHVGFGLLNEKGEVVEVLKDGGSFTLAGNESEYELIWMYIREGDLPEGTHHVATICKLNPDDVWQRIGGSQSYFEVVIGEDNEVKSVVLHPVRKLKITNITYSDKIVANMPFEVKATVENIGDDVNMPLRLVATSKDGTQFFGFTYAPLYMRQHEIMECYSELSIPVGGDYNLWIAETMDTVNYYAKFQVEVLPAPKSPANLEIIKAEIDPNGVVANFTIRNHSEEPYYRGLAFILYGYDSVGGGYSIKETVVSSKEIQPGGIEEYSVLFNEVESNCEFSLYVEYYHNHYDYYATRLGDVYTFKSGSVSVEEVKVPINTYGTIYRLDGTRLKHTLHDNIYIIDGVKRLVKTKQ